MSSAFTSNTAKISNPKRILLVDVISLFKMVLEVNGFQVNAYTDPSAALSNFKPNLYDLALLDIKMTPLNGFELYKEMKKVAFHNDNL